MNILVIQLLCNDINICDVNCFQKKKRIFELRTILLFLSTCYPVALRTNSMFF